MWSKTKCDKNQVWQKKCDQKQNVIQKNVFLFSIECKFKNSQAAQFVVLHNKKERKFLFSNKNKASEDRCREIIDHMNQNYQEYSKGDSQKLDVDKRIMFKSVISHYKEKNVKFFLSSKFDGDFENNFIKIIKIDDIDKHFEINGVYRRKRSGTRQASKSDLEMAKPHLRNIFNNYELNNREGRMFIATNEETNNKKFGANQEFYLSEKEYGYELRKRSTTQNRNIIFSLSFQPADKKSNLELILNEIKKLSS